MNYKSEFNLQTSILQKRLDIKCLLALEISSNLCRINFKLELPCQHEMQKDVNYVSLIFDTWNEIAQPLILNKRHFTVSTSASKVFMRKSRKWFFRCAFENTCLWICHNRSKLFWFLVTPPRLLENSLICFQQWKFSEM